jgi:hypothetical protein
MVDGGLTVCKNLIPQDTLYKPFYGKSDYSSDAYGSGDAGLYGIEYKANNGSYYPFIFSDDNIYKLNSDKTLTDVTRAAGVYTMANNNWSTAQFGDWVIATNLNDVPQVKKNMTNSDAFVALGGSPPSARYCLFFSGHFILAHIASYPKKIQWSALEDPETWTASLTTGADAQDLADADGDITGICQCGDGFAVFHERSITKGRYIGGQYTFDLKQNWISNIGAVQNTVISVGSIAYFWGEKDLYMFDGQSLTPIGEGIRETLLNSYDTNYKHRITAVYEAKKGVIYWSYPDTSGSGTPNKLLCYNISNKRFTSIDLPDHGGIFLIRQGGVTNIDASAFNTLYPSADAMPESSTYYADSQYWLASNPVIAVLNTSTRKVATLNGTVTEGWIETGDIKLGENILYVDGIRPLSEYNSSFSVYLATKYNEDDIPPVYSNALAYNSTSGNFDGRYSGRYLRMKILTGEHNGILGVEVMARPAGKR